MGKLPPGLAKWQAEHGRGGKKAAAKAKPAKGGKAAKKKTTR